MIKNLLIVVFCSIVFVGACKKDKPSVDSFLTSGIWVEKTYRKSGDAWSEVIGDTIEYRFDSDRTGERFVKRRNRHLYRPTSYGQIPSGYWKPVIIGARVDSTFIYDKTIFNWKYELKKLRLEFDRINQSTEWEITDFTSSKIDTKSRDNSDIYSGSVYTFKSVFEKK